MYSYLSGPPKVNDYTFPFGQNGQTWEPDWNAEESFWWTDRDGTKHLRERRWRARIAPGWAYIDADDWEALKIELEKNPITVTPATKTADDPDWATELTFDCRLVSAVPAGEPMRDGKLGVRLEFETLAVYAEKPDVVSGGFEEVA